MVRGGGLSTAEGRAEPTRLRTPACTLNRSRSLMAITSCHQPPGPGPGGWWQLVVAISDLDLFNVHAGVRKRPRGGVLLATANAPSCA